MIPVYFLNTHDIPLGNSTICIHVLPLAPNYKVWVDQNLSYPVDPTIGILGRKDEQRNEGAG